MIKKIVNKLKEVTHAWKVQVFTYPSDNVDDELSYDEYWKTRRKNQEMHLGVPQLGRLERVVDILSEEDGVQSVSDIGGADGSFVYFLKKQLPHIKQVTCVDTSAHALAIAEKHDINIALLDLSKDDALQSIPRADVQMALEVLEHVPNSELLLRSMYDHAEKAVIFSFPNTGYVPYRLRLLFGRTPMQWAMHPAEHLRFWTFKDVAWWLKALGYEEVKFISHRGVPVLNKILPNLFSADIFVKIDKK